MSVLREPGSKQGARPGRSKRSSDVTVVEDDAFAAGVCHGSQSQSHVTADGQSASQSWCRAPSGTHDQMLCHGNTTSTL
jgi:hypothetical protein